MNYKEFLSNHTNSFTRIPQTVIIDGSNHSSRLEAADTLAMAFMCEHKNLCQECASCKRVKAHSHTEISYIEREKDKKTIAVSVARKIKSRAYVNPVESDIKVFIITEADRLGEEAQNALLKVLEEPPVFDRFILCAENASALLSTIRSRAVRITLPVSFETDLSDKEGSLAQRIARAVLNGDEAQLVFLLPKIEKDRTLAVNTLQKLRFILRDALVMKFSADSVTDSDASYEMSQNWSKARIMECIKALDHAEQMISNNVKTGLSLTVLFSKMTVSKSL